MRRTGGVRGALLALAAAALVALAPAPALAEATNTMYRLYNPNSGEHFYTASAKERDSVVAAGWNDEGVGWVAPAKSNTPVYRLYSGTDHHYTMSKEERDHLVEVGWKDEGVGWYSDDAKRVPLYRQFNPYVDPSAPRNNSGSHNYTTSKAENDHLVSVGWRAEGIGWYAVKGGYATSKPVDPAAFADNAGQWSVWGQIKWRIAGGTLYVRPASSPNGAAAITAQDGRHSYTEAPWSEPLNDAGMTVTRILSSGTISLQGNEVGLFAFLPKLADISALRAWNTSGATDMGDMFSGCESLSDVSPLANWDVSNVTKMSGMFNGCTALKDARALNGWNVSKVDGTSYVFGYGGFPQSGLPNWAK
jgi:surface protein